MKLFLELGVHSLRTKQLLFRCFVHLLCNTRSWWVLLFSSATERTETTFVLYLSAIFIILMSETKVPVTHEFCTRQKFWQNLLDLSNDKKRKLWKHRELRFLRCLYSFLIAFFSFLPLFNLALKWHNTNLFVNVSFFW